MGETWLTMMVQVLALFGIIGIGAGARQANWLTEEADETLLKLVIRVLLPALIFDVILGDERLTEARNILLPPLVGFGTVVGGFAVAALVARWAKRPLRLHQPAERRTFGLCVGLYNYGYLPLPLAAALFDKSTVGVLFVHNLGVEVAVWTAGVMLVSGDVSGHWWKRAINAPTLAIAAALLLNALGWHVYVPGFVRLALTNLGVCAVPMALLLIGATIADHLRSARLTQGAPVMSGAAVLRLGLLPAAFVAMAWVLPVTVELKRVILIQAAMPSAVFPIVLAKHYGGDVSTAVRVVLATSVLSLVTMPLWLSAGMWLLGIQN